MFEKNLELLKKIVQNIAYVRELDRYYCCLSSGWKECSKKDLEFIVKQMIKKEINNSDDISVKGELKAILSKKDCGYCSYSTYLTDFLNRIQEISLVNIDKLNGNPSLLRTKSNHYDLQETKVIESGLKTNYMINMLGTNFDTEAKAPKWEKFISEIVSNNLEYAGFLQRLIGYILSGYTVEQCLFILIGTGANGKTVFTETIKNLLGTYANMADKKLLAKNGKGADKEISNLIGKRLVILNELDSDTKIRIDTFKKITGSDSLCFEFNKQHVEFQNTAKIFILSNTFPDIQDYTYATWRRIKILPFITISGSLR
jgi:putative DNA primase/helicase